MLVIQGMEVHVLHVLPARISSREATQLRQTVSCANPARILPELVLTRQALVKDASMARFPQHQGQIRLLRA